MTTALLRLRQEDRHRFEASQGCMVRAFLKTNSRAVQSTLVTQLLGGIGRKIRSLRPTLVS